MRGFNSVRVHRGRIYQRRAALKRSRGGGVKAAVRLVRGAEGYGSLYSIRTHLAEVYGRSLSEIFNIIDSRDRSRYYMVSYLSRTLLETSAAAALSRLDPFRVLALRKAQADGQYDPGRRSLLAIEWGRDVITKDGGDRPQWSSLKGLDAYSRGLLDSPWLSLAFADAISRSADAARQNSGPWIRDLREKDPESLWRFIRGQCAQLYSSLSKLVHVEFMDKLAESDHAGIVDNAIRSIKISMLIVYVSNFLDHSSGCLSSEIAVGDLMRAQLDLAEVNFGRL